MKCKKRRSKIGRKTQIGLELIIKKIKFQTIFYMKFVRDWLKIKNPDITYKNIFNNN